VPSTRPLVVVPLQSLRQKRESNLDQLEEKRTWKEKRKQSGRNYDQNYTTDKLLKGRRRQLANEAWSGKGST
jgi:hypothetical protein